MDPFIDLHKIYKVNSFILVLLERKLIKVCQLIVIEFYGCQLVLYKEYVQERSLYSFHQVDDN